MGLNLGSLFSDSLGSIIKEIGVAIDNNITSTEEKLTLKVQLKQIELAALNKHEEIQKELDISADTQATERLKADMLSDNKWSKNIRPLSFAFSLGMFTLFTFSDGNITTDTGSFSVRDPYIEVWMYILLFEVSFYFSSRGLEKISEIVGKLFMRK